MDRIREFLTERGTPTYLVTAGQYAAAFVVLFAGLYARKIVDLIFEKYLKRLTSLTRFHLDDVVVEAASAPARWSTAVIGLYWALLILEIEVPLRPFTSAAFGILGLAFLLRFIDGFTEYLRPLAKQTNTSLDDAILPALRTAAKVFVVIVGSLWVVDNLGYNISTIIAGLGIGGLAVALAAQGTLSNWFGAFMIFADRPFSAGQIVTVGDTTGTVEQVGLRSTSIRTFDGTLVNIPNSIVANSKIDNVSRMPGRRYKGTIGVTYDTPPEKVEQALGIIRAILEHNSHIQQGYVVRFDDFGASSLNIQVIYVANTVDYREYMEIKEGINLEILRSFNEAAIEFAFPTQTVYVKGAV